jgi:hypothetical protein
MKGLIAFCLLLAVIETVLAIKDKENVILYSLHSMEGTLYVIAMLYFYSKSRQKSEYNNKASLTNQ